MKKLVNLLRKIEASTAPDLDLDKEIHRVLFPDDEGTAPEFTGRVIAAMLLVPECDQPTTARHILAAEVRSRLYAKQAARPSISDKTAARFVRRVYRDAADELPKRQWNDWVDALPFDEFAFFVCHNWQREPMPDLTRRLGVAVEGTFAAQPEQNG